MNFSLDFFIRWKIAIVTGGNKGLGQAYAVALAKAGADLFVVSHGDEWDETRAINRKTGRRVEVFPSGFRQIAKKQKK